MRGNSTLTLVSLAGKSSRSLLACHTFGIGPGALRIPARPACRRRTSRGSAGACGHNSPQASGYATRRLFFSPNQRGNPCRTLDLRSRMKAREPISVEQTPGSLRRSSYRWNVPYFRPLLKAEKNCDAGTKPRLVCEGYPHVSTKNLFFRYQVLEQFLSSLSLAHRSVCNRPGPAPEAIHATR